MEQTKYCQSCGMPLGEDDYGSNADGSVNTDYCKYCYVNGEFNNPNETMEEMVESCVPFMVQSNEGMTEDEARKLMLEAMPHLKRWTVK